MSFSSILEKIAIPKTLDDFINKTDVTSQVAIGGAVGQCFKQILVYKTLRFKRIRCNIYDQQACP